MSVKSGDGQRILERFAHVCEAPVDDCCGRSITQALGAILLAQGQIFRTLSRCPEVCETVDLSELRSAIIHIEELLAPAEPRVAGVEGES